MTVEFITKEDLHLFKKELLQELLTALQASQKETQWLKSSDVRGLLKISPNTLQRLRINGILKFSKVGSTFFYRTDDVRKMLEGKKSK